MSIKSDKWIRRMAAAHGMIEPFEAGQVRPVNLEDLTARADRIFAGRCLRTSVVSRPQLGTVTRRRTADASPGTVVGQRPAAGTLAAPGTVVDIVVARSPQ